MSAKVWFRVSSILLLLFAVGHTFGFLNFRGSTPESVAVRASMDAVHFPASPGGAATLSFGGFYLGFGLFISAAFVFAAWVAWKLGTMAARGDASPDVAALGWGMAALMLFNVALSVRYFSGAPVVLSVVAVICLATATWLARRRATAD
ncbi:MAG TPA: hypothetical protein VIJ79_13975 [Acidobacteriaceae bacterium]